MRLGRSLHGIEQLEIGEAGKEELIGCPYGYCYHVSLLAKGVVKVALGSSVLLAPGQALVTLPGFNAPSQVFRLHPVFCVSSDITRSETHLAHHATY